VVQIVIEKNAGIPVSSEYSMKKIRTAVGFSVGTTLL